MQDCEEVDVTLPVRQGDVLKRVQPDGKGPLIVVVTADCDIANNKFGDAGLVCVQLTPLVNYMLNEHAAVHAKRQLRKRFEKATEWVNKRWLESDPSHIPLSEESVQRWLTQANPDSIESALGLPLNDKKSFIKRESAALRSAHELIENSKDQFSALDALRTLQSKSTSRAMQLKTLFGTLDPWDLPLDMFFISSVPGEPDVGFIAKLRALSFVPLNLSFTSMAAAKEYENAFLRVGRLAPTFRHAMAQQFGMLFSRIGLPKLYEIDREAAFAMLAEQMANDMGDE